MKNQEYTLLKNFVEIPEIAGEGYVWYSNSDKPRVLNNTNDLKKNDLNPFIVEAHFYSAQTQTSIGIFSDGNHPLISLVHWDRVGNTTLSQETFITHRLNNKKIMMVQAWKPVPDDLCEGMEVLSPAWRMFKGFVSSKKEE